jgi:hypothetical protein
MPLAPRPSAGGALAADEPVLARVRPLLSGSARHLVSRFSYGVTPGLAKQVVARGGAQAWFEWQLEPSAILDRSTAELADWWPGLRYSGPQAWSRHASDVEPGWVLMANYQRWILMRRIRTQRQVHELMTEFWEHHLHVPTNGEASFTYRKRYGDTIRKHALGTYEEMLEAAITHPAMLIFLDNAVSTARHPNENLARELLELHTVGRGNHDEDDVKNTARILTGWRVDLWNTWDVWYDTPSHWTGQVKVLGFNDANAARDGRDVTRRFLRYLARHPLTAQRIARKLAVRFVRDDPSQGLVDRLAQVYLDHGTAIRPVLRALVASAEFQASAGLKIRTPVDDVVATYRALGVRVQKPSSDNSAANAILWQTNGLGASPLGWPRPDGMPQSNQAWATAARLMGSMRVHFSMSGGWWPNVDVRYPGPASRAPDFPIRFDDLVEHLSQTLLHRRSSDTLLQACCQALDVTPGERITREHGVIKWGMPRLLTTFLDSPAFYSR